MQKIHTILILAGGDGDRFVPLQDKMRFSFNGKTVLQHIISGVKEYAEHVVVVTSKENKTLIEDDLSYFDVKYALQTEDKGGMADAVIAAKKFLTKDALILNGNDIFDFTILSAVIEKTKEDNNLVGMMAKRMETYFPGGYVRFENDLAVEIVEKPLPEQRPSDYCNLVTDYFPDVSLFIAELEKTQAADDQFEKAISAIMKMKPATCIRYEGDWATLKYSWHVLSMQEYFFTHQLEKSIDTSAKIHKTALIEGGVYIGKDVKIGAFCKIMGPCYIGDNSIIGDHSLIRNSSIGKNVLVGSGCEVARSYLANEVMLHRNYVGDSVLSEGVSMGAGAVTANYRFDAKNVSTPIKGNMTDTNRGKFGLIAGKGVKIGVNVSTYPGVKLAPGAKVLPGDVVSKDK